MKLQQVGERLRLRLVGRPEVNAPGTLGGLQAGRHEVLQEPVGVPPGGPHRGQRGGQVPADAVGQGQQGAVGAVDRQPAAAAPGHLVGHADGAVQAGIGIAVAGVEEVVVLRLVVGPALAVEGLGVGAAEGVEPGQHAAVDARMHRLGGGREEVARVRGHLVEVHVDLGLPGAVGGDAAAALLLRRPGPVAVEIDQVVVLAAAGPGLEVLGGDAVDVRRLALALLVAVEVALAAVRVAQRVDQHDDVVEQPRPVTLRGGERVRRHHGGLGGGRLVAVHAVGQPHDRRQAPGEALALALREGLGVGEAEALGPDLVEVRQVLRAADGGQLQRPPLVGAPVLPDLDPRRRGGEGVEVGGDVLPVGEAAAHGIAEHGIGARDGRVEGRQLDDVAIGQRGQEPRRRQLRQRRGESGKRSRRRHRRGERDRQDLESAPHGNPLSKKLQARASHRNTLPRRTDNGEPRVVGPGRRMRGIRPRRHSRRRC